MKTSNVLLTSLLLLGGVAAVADAASDREVHQKRVAKVAPLGDAKPKALCACSLGTAFPNRTGYIRQFVASNQVLVQCVGDIFDLDGNDVGGFACTDFYPLTK